MSQTATLEGSTSSGATEHFDVVIVDECHHLPAASFERVLAETKARYVVGLTATPLRRDGHHRVARGQRADGARSRLARS